MSDTKTPEEPGLEALAVLLNHARSLFEYHAGQRLTTIRYYFLAYAVFATAYVTAHASDKTQNISPYFQLAIGFSAIVITIVFWVLDFRNAQMVVDDEQALEEVEDLISRKYGLEKFRLAKTWDRPNQKFIKYRFMTKIIFGYFLLVSILATIGDGVRLIFLS